MSRVFTKSQTSSRSPGAASRSSFLSPAARTSTAGSPRATGRLDRLARPPHERGTNEGAEVTEGRHSRGGRGGRLARSVTSCADGERQGVGDPHPHETEANQPGSRSVYQQRSAETKSGQDGPSPENPHGATARDEPITSQAPQRYSTQKEAKGYCAESLCPSKRLRYVHGGPVQTSSLRQREAKR